MATKGTKFISVILCCFLFHFFFYTSHSKEFTDTIRNGQQLKDTEQLSSDNNYFRLKFFISPILDGQRLNYARNKYLGIFYNQPYNGYRYDNKAVWVANRNNPITELLSGMLMIDEYGNMTILYNGGKQVVLYSSQRAANVSAKLLDTGNFILREMNSDGSRNKVLWQSFDYPTDTLLPGMKLGIDLNTGHNWSLTSWIAEYSPASGSFTLGVDPNGTNQLIIWWNGKIYWTSGFWIDGKFDHVPMLSHRFDHHFSYVSNNKERHFTYSVSKKYTFPRYTMEPEGTVSENAESTIFGECFPTHVTDSGCAEKKLPKCRNTSLSFYDQEGYMFGDGIKLDESSKIGPFDCKAKCLNDCSCVACASTDEDGTGCELWSQDMEFISRDNDHTARTVHVLFDQSEEAHPEIKKGLSTALLIIVAVGIPVTLMLFSLFQLIRRKPRLPENAKKSVWALASVVKKCGVAVWIVVKYYVANIKRRHETIISMEKDDGDGKRSPELRFFSFKSLASATDNFATRNELGKGGFGPVYKGKLQSGQQIAIKRLSRTSGQGLTEFKNELTLIARLQHTNLVRLVGCCIQRKEMMLIYEYMSNRSLDFFLFDPNRRSLLDWNKRFDIIQGIAQGLLYLHKYSRLRMIHRDLKAGNILLDDEMSPKISDFGMARIFEQNESKANTNRVVGTFGYMSPEYARKGICSLKSDVFSFGVLLLEIISGTKNNSYCQPEQLLNLTGHAWKLWKEDRTLELMDSTLNNSYDSNQVLRCIHVGLLCVQDNPIDRPTMADVAAMISYETIPLSAPKQPAFFIHDSLPAIEINVQRLETFSSNRVSITEMDASTLIKACTEIMARDWHLQVSNVFREANSCADFMANWSLKYGPGMIMLKDPPEEMYSLLLSDCKSVAKARVI